MLRCSALKGFRITGVTDQLVTSLFADDTTVYLSSEDSFQLLQSILDKWCMASSAKFNKDKTILPPIGSPEYRKKVLETRSMDAEGLEMLPDDIHIVKDAESIRILGAQIGNKCLDSESWTKTLEEIDEMIVWSGKSHPTLEGKSHTIEQTIAAKTQYKVQVSGMPKNVVKRLDEILCT
ncbi:hypothetical protein C8J56DRAFT_800462 [Mycena floridula]|nr:hypothetical protein C8J56DRAFT_800462 [Mycena floridula]